MFTFIRTLPKLFVALFFLVVATGSVFGQSSGPISWKFTSTSAYCKYGGSQQILYGIGHFSSFAYTDPSTHAVTSLSGTVTNYFNNQNCASFPFPGTKPSPDPLVLNTPGGVYHFVASSYGDGGTATLQPPPPIIGFINPKYIVVGITYAPPGTSSSVTYSNTTSVGNTTTVMHSFQSDTGFSVSLSNGLMIPAGGIVPGTGGSAGVKLTFTESTDYTIGSSSSTTISMSKASTISYTTPGTPTFSPVNSDYDFIWLWLNPELLTSYYVPNGSNPAKLVLTGYAFDPTDPASGEPPPSGPYISGPDIVEVQVGCLNGHFSCPSTLVVTNGVVTSGTLARSWAANEYTWPAGEGPGLTSADIAQILALDPLVPSNNYTLLSGFPSTTSDGRFTKDPYPPNPVQYPVGAATEMYSLVQTNTRSVASGTTNQTKQAFGVSEEWGTNFLGIWTSTVTLTESETLTWNYSWLDTVTNTTTLTNQLSVKGPPDPPPTYSGPIQFIAYQDNLFGTFAFVPVTP